MPIFFCVLFLVPGLTESSNTGSDSGAHCLYTVARAFNHGPLLFDEFTKQHPSENGGLYSAADIVENARLLNLEALAVDAPMGDLLLAQPPVACILRLDSGHFVLLLGEHDGDVMVLNPADNLERTVSLPSHWRGPAVLISDRPIALNPAGQWSVIAAAVCATLVCIAALAASKWLLGRGQ